MRRSSWLTSILWTVDKRFEGFVVGRKNEVHNTEKLFSSNQKGRLFHKLCDTNAPRPVGADRQGRLKALFKVIKKNQRFTTIPAVRICRQKRRTIYKNIEQLQKPFTSKKRESDGRAAGPPSTPDYSPYMEMFWV